MKKDIKHSENCPMLKTMRVIGGKWKLPLVYYLQDGAKRFSVLQKDLPAVTTKMLTQQLRELERDGVVSRKIYPVIPPKVEYSLTKRGNTLLPILVQLSLWGAKLRD